MAFQFAHIFGNRPDAVARPTRPRLQISEWPAAVYAIGDVHGCAAQLQLLHQKIIADAASMEGEKLIVGLGDYVDRGVDSAGVLDFLAKPLPLGFRRICLAGNHEVMMLEHLADPRASDRWLHLGGIETLISYDIDPSRYLAASARDRSSMLQSHIPSQHLEFLDGLPLTVALPGVVLVHAGLRAGIPLIDQDEDDLLWIREPLETDSDIEGSPLVVHGHTPVSEPVIAGKDISIDTGAFATGILTAVRLQQGEAPFFLAVGAPDRA